MGHGTSLDHIGGVVGRAVEQGALMIEHQERGAEHVSGVLGAVVALRGSECIFGTVEVVDQDRRLERGLDHPEFAFRYGVNEIGHSITSFWVAKNRFDLYNNIIIVYVKVGKTRGEIK